MVTRSKLLLSVIVGLVVTLGLGFAWGASGRFDLESALEESQQQLDLAEARGSLLTARVSLYNLNFGEAASQFEEAKAPLQRVRQRYQEDDKDAAARSIDSALEHVQEGQRLAGKLDQTANAKAAQALDAIKAATRR